jgi:hypothetical protein
MGWTGRPTHQVDGKSILSKKAPMTSPACSTAQPRSAAPASAGDDREHVIPLRSPDRKARSSGLLFPQAAPQRCRGGRPRLGLPGVHRRWLLEAVGWRSDWIFCACSPFGPCHIKLTFEPCQGSEAIHLMAESEQRRRRPPVRFDQTLGVIEPLTASSHGYSSPIRSCWSPFCGASSRAVKNRANPWAGAATAS